MRFLRNTHVDGVFRKELKDKVENPPLVLHMLSPSAPMTFDEVCAAQWRYERQEDGMPSSLANEISFGLVKLIEDDCVKVVP